MEGREDGTLIAPETLRVHLVFAHDKLKLKGTAGLAERSFTYICGRDLLQQ